MEEGTESEQISDNFTCAVCLDLLYKPIVLVCGHVSCFWCCQHSMDMRSESHCPLCRHPNHHFPAICQTLHFLLKKLYPISYNKRNIQTLEEEKESALGFAPDIDTLITNQELSKKVSVNDVLCDECKQLLLRPVVLNCGHVYCEACIMIPNEGMIKCKVCESRHPSGLPKVCRELHHFIEDNFSSEYELRRSCVQVNQEYTQNRNILNEGGSQFPKMSFPTAENFLQWWTAHGSKFHDGVGCDMCGMRPIIGDRYRCNDCTEKCGYDLCGDCHTTGSNLPGRFSQKHTPQHHLQLIKPVINRNVIYRLLSGQLELVSSIASRTQPSPVDGSPQLPSPSDTQDLNDTQPPNS